MLILFFLHVAVVDFFWVKSIVRKIFEDQRLVSLLIVPHLQGALEEVSVGIEAYVDELRYKARMRKACKVLCKIIMRSF